MKKTIQISIAVLLLSLFGGCVIGPTHGILFTTNKFAGEFNPANDVKPAKSGVGCQHYFLGLVAFGEAGAGAVAKENGIERIAHIDHSTLGVFSGFYSNYCTIVYGE